MPSTKVAKHEYEGTIQVLLRRSFEDFGVELRAEKKHDAVDIYVKDVKDTAHQNGSCIICTILLNYICK